MNLKLNESTVGNKMSANTKISQIHEDIESLTIHGISRVASAKNKYTRVIWLVLCISAAVVFGIVAVNSFTKYYQYHNYIDSSVKQHNTLTLPAITFCHTNFYHPFAYHNEDPPVFQKLPKNCSFIDQKYFASKMNQMIFEFACRTFIGKVKSKTTAMLSDTPQYFRFPTGFEIAPNKLPCITLNRNSTLVQQAVSEKYGLHMILYYEAGTMSQLYSPVEPLTDGRNGIYATIHDSKQVVTIGDGTVLPPGYHTHISITKNVIKRLQHPYSSNCTNNWSNRDSIYPGKNTQQMCLSSCAYKQAYKICPGVLPEMKVFMKAPKFPLSADIYNASFWECLQKSLTKIDYRLCDCPEHCHEEIYTTVISRNPWPQYWQASSFMKLVNDIEGTTNRTLSTAEISKRLLKVSIYYENFKEYIYEEQPLYDLSTIASDLGGQMGLFMGASLISIAEIISLAATCFKRCLCRSEKSIELSSS